MTCSVSNNVYQITFGSSHTAGANYVIPLTGPGAVATVHTVAPTATGFQVVLYSTSAARGNEGSSTIFLHRSSLNGYINSICPHREII